MQDDVDAVEDVRIGKQAHAEESAIGHHVERRVRVRRLLEALCQGHARLARAESAAGDNLDLSSNITRLRGVKGCDVIFDGSWNPFGAQFVRAVRDAGIKTPIATNASVNGLPVVQNNPGLNDFYALGFACLNTYCSGSKNPAVAALNAKFGGGTASDVIAAAGTAGAQPNAGDLNATLPSIFVVMTFMMWNWWSVYLSGELKTAANRGRQMKIMFGALAWDVIFICLGVILLFRVTGYDFMAAVNTGGEAVAGVLKLPTSPWYHFVASLVFNAPILTIVIVGSLSILTRVATRGGVR